MVAPVRSLGVWQSIGLGCGPIVRCLATAGFRFVRWGHPRKRGAGRGCGGVRQWWGCCSISQLGPISQFSHISHLSHNASYRMVIAPTAGGGRNRRQIGAIAARWAHSPPGRRIDTGLSRTLHCSTGNRGAARDRGWSDHQAGRFSATAPQFFASHPTSSGDTPHCRTGNRGAAREQPDRSTSTAAAAQAQHPHRDPRRTYERDP